MLWWWWGQGQGGHREEGEGELAWETVIKVSSESGHQERRKTNQTVKEEEIPFFLSSSPALFQIRPPISASLILSQHCPHVYHLKKMDPEASSVSLGWGLNK